MGYFFVSIDELKQRIGTAAAPLVFDVRRRNAFQADGHVLPAAQWRDHRLADEWADEISSGSAAVAYCEHGHQVSQSAVAMLRARGVDAHALEGGIEGWRQAGGLAVAKAALPNRDWSGPSRWVTRTRPKIDRIACPWFVLRFVDPKARFFFVSPDQVSAAAKEIDAIPFDIEGVEFSHDGERCSFDIFLDRFGISDAALRDLAMIVRGADTARPDLAPEAQGLLALSLGLSVLTDGDDAGMLAKGMLFYDALYAWRRHATAETHNWPAAKTAA